jgi:hypothetical protein
VVVGSIDALGRTGGDDGSVPLQEGVLAVRDLSSRRPNAAAVGAAGRRDPPFDALHLPPVREPPNGSWSGTPPEVRAGQSWLRGVQVPSE